MLQSFTELVTREQKPTEILVEDFASVFVWLFLIQFPFPGKEDSVDSEMAIACI
jgi:hypothetical protein